MLFAFDSDGILKYRVLIIHTQVHLITAILEFFKYSYSRLLDSMALWSHGRRKI